MVLPEGLGHLTGILGRGGGLDSRTKRVHGLAESGSGVNGRNGGCRCQQGSGGEEGLVHDRAPTQFAAAECASVMME